MTFNELLEKAKNNPKYSFFLGMVYGWPLSNDGYIETYSEIYIDERAKVVNRLFSRQELLDLNNKNTQAVYKFIRNTDISRDDIKIISSEKSWKFVVQFENSQRFDVNSHKDRALLYGQIEKVLLDMSVESKRYFIAGMFNARASLDFTTGYFAIDIEKREFPEFIKRKYFAISNLTGDFYNYNPRILQENANKKNDQLRPKIDLFVSVFGLFLPFKQKYFEKVKHVNLSQDGDLYVYKTDIPVDRKDYNGYARGLKINQLAIQFQNKEISEEELLRQRTALGLDNDDDIDTILYANPSVKESRKVRSKYRCEIDPTHRTFTAKINKEPFVEGHHLIPFCKRNDFDVNIDIVENIVALCPVCHRLVHLATDDEKRVILTKLYEYNIKDLQKAGINISLEQLIEFYN